MMRTSPQPTRVGFALVAAVLTARPLRRYLLPVVALLLLLFVAVHTAAADGIIIPRPPIDPPVPWREIPLTIKYHRVEVTIADQVATTRVDQVFVNEAIFPVEGAYIFPLPEDAAISSFDMWVDGQKLEGKLLGRDEARAIYEDIVRRQRDPALLEYVGRGAFQASIFPIPPKGERRIQLTYAQVLGQDNGLVYYRYPLNTEKFSARNIEDVSVTVRIADKAPLRAIYSPSHPVDVTREAPNRATVSYEARDVRPDRDFDLYYSISPDAIAANLLSYKPYDEDGFFLLLLTPPVQAATDEVVAKDVVLVFDVSGSMDGAKIAQARDAASYVLQHLGPADRFNIIAFSSATRLFAPAPVGSERVADGLAFIKGLTAQGSTDINRALLEALAGVDSTRPTILLFMTDGLPTAGETVPDRIVANVSAAAPKSVRLFAFGVGYDVDTVLLGQLSANHRGTAAYVRPDEKIDEQVAAFYARISAPVLVDVQMTLAGVQVEDIYPYPLPDLFAGTQLVVAGRYRQAGVADLKLTGAINGRPQTYAYDGLTFVARGGNEFILRLWAQRKIGYLLTQIRLVGSSKELVDEVVALSMRYGIVTPYTSFLVEEPQAAVGPRPTVVAPGVFDTGGAAPASAPERSGERAVESVVVEKAMQESEQAAAVPAAAAAVAPVLQQVGDKTFVVREGVWTDTIYDAAAQQAEQIAFASPRYFQLLADYPALGRYLALGDRVAVVLAGRAYLIGPGGATEQTGAQPDSTALPALSPTVAPPTPAAVPELPTAAPLTGATPAAPTPAPVGQPICPAAAVVGIVGMLPPVAYLVRRRHYRF